MTTNKKNNNILNTEQEGKPEYLNDNTEKLLREIAWETNNILLNWYAISPDRDKEFIEKFWERYIKYKKLIKLWIEITPAKFEKNTKSTYILKNSDNLHKLSDENLDKTTNLKIAWRILAIRRHWKLIFIDLQDSHWRIQIYINKNDLTQEENEILKLLDIWDFIWIKWFAFLTKREEPSLYTKQIEILWKALRPLPEKFHWVTDKETIYRQPYLNTIMDPEVREMFILRSKIISEIRRFMDDNWFLEIETPILGNTASGALASSFETHHNALDIDLNLRIAPETNLKKAVVWWFEKVYEIWKQFRNEWTSPDHLQEFTSMEFYWSYVDKNRLMDFTKDFLINLLDKINKTRIIPYLWKDIDFSWDWPRYTLRDLIYNNSGIDIDNLKTSEELIEEVITKWLDIDIPNWVSRWNLIDLIYKKVARPKLIDPCFVTDHPIDVTPLARRNDENKDNTDRFQLVINWVEVVNAYGELVDAIDQRLRFEDQAKSRDDWDEEAHMMDEDYVTAMEYGMPPISGWWIWIDRLVAILTDQENLKDVIMFPLNRPKK